MKKKNVFIFLFLITCLLFVGCSFNKNIDEEIPILLYHSVVPELEDNHSSSMYVSEKNFEEDLKFLKEKGYETISLEDMASYYKGENVDLPEKPIVITFDDGYLNNYEYAFPLLKKYDTKAAIYMIGWSVGRDTFINSEKPITPHFNWEQAEEMVQSGLVELGSHTYDLHNEPGKSYGLGEDVGLGLAKMESETEDDYKLRIAKDLKKSKDMIEKNTSQKVTSIAYPYGEYNSIVIELLDDLGFRSGLITESKEKPKSEFDIRRIIVTDELRVKDIL